MQSAVIPIAPRPALSSLPDRVRLPLAVDLGPLIADLVALESTHWTPHFVPAHFAGDWSVLPLRAPQGAKHPILQITSNPSITAWDDTAFLGASPAIIALLAALPCRLGTVRLMRLAAGSIIHEHRDDDLDAALGMARLHIPLLTNAKVDFRLNGQSVHLAAGECWYLRLADRHSVANHGQTNRVHLVIDAFVDDWLEQHLLAAAAVEQRS